MSLSDEIRDSLKNEGVPVVGFADLTILPPETRQNFDRGIAIGLVYSAAAIRENRNGNPGRYYAEFQSMNKRLPRLAAGVADLLARRGYKAWAKAAPTVVQNGDLRTVLPHKTVATRAGLGWIGKCALLVTREFGSALRLVVVLTDAPLECGAPVTRSNCPKGCSACMDACPGHAPLGRLWSPETDRAAFFDAHACRTAARARAAATLGVDESVCGLCIANCPYTIHALEYGPVAGRMEEP